VIPFRLDANTDEIQSTIPSNSKIPISFATTFEGKPSAQHAETLKWVLQQGRPVDIDIQVELSNEVFELLEDLLVKATDFENVPPIILCTCGLLNDFFFQFTFLQSKFASTTSTYGPSNREIDESSCVSNIPSTNRSSIALCISAYQILATLLRRTPYPPSRCQSQSRRQ